jgi:hypothetical protein
LNPEPRTGEPFVSFKLEYHGAECKEKKYLRISFNNNIIDNSWSASPEKIPDP